MNKRVWRRLALSVLLAVGITASGCTGQTATPATTSAAEAPPEDQSAVIPETFQWNVPRHIAAPLRNCNNDERALLTTWVPCLKDTFKFKIGKKLDVTGNTYGFNWNGETGTISLNITPYQIFMVVVNIDGNGWKPLDETASADGNPTYDPIAKMGVNWLRGKSYDVVVTLWDPTDPENKTSNRRGVEVPFDWAVILPQRLGKTQK